LYCRGFVIILQVLYNDDDDNNNNEYDVVFLLYAWQIVQRAASFSTWTKCCM